MQTFTELTTGEGCLVWNRSIVWRNRSKVPTLHVCLDSVLGKTPKLERENSLISVILIFFRASYPRGSYPFESFQMSPPRPPPVGQSITVDNYRKWDNLIKIITLLSDAGRADFFWILENLTSQTVVAVLPPPSLPSKTKVIWIIGCVLPSIPRCSSSRAILQSRWV